MSQLFYVHTPPPLPKVLMTLYIAMLIGMDDSMKTLINSRLLPLQIKTEEDINTTFYLSFKGQQLLFCCFFNILALHLSSFVWYSHKRANNIPQNIILLEHILHYYFALAFILHLFNTFLNLFKIPTISNECIEMIAATQMCLYFQWHIFCEIKRLLPKQSHFFIQTSMYMFIFGIIPIFWARMGDIRFCTFHHTDNTTIHISSCKNSETHHNNDKWINMIYLLFFLHSILLLAETGGLLFQWLEIAYSYLFTSTDQNQDK